MKSALGLTPLAAALALAFAAPASAVEFEFDTGLRANLDTTVSYGVSMRAKGREPSLIGIANGGTSRSVNEDNGDLNFDKNHPFANIIKATSDLEVKYQNITFFGRGTAYWDFNLHNSDKLGETGKQRLGHDVVGLDGFVQATFAPLDRNLRVRAGRQVINWGESTFIAGGINVINPVDLAKLRVPGSELKEALLPTTGVWASQEISRSVTIEGFLLTNFDKIRIDPKGSYFSSNDTISDDSTRTILSFGRRHDEHVGPTNIVPPGIPVISATANALFGPPDPNAPPVFGGAAMLWFPRLDDRNPSDNGQHGVALRYFAREFNNTEFGFYYINYHSRTPIVSTVRGTPSSIITGSPLQAPICGTPALSQLCHSGTAGYFAEFPENIRLFGVSFNTAGPWGIALQGEYSYRPNLPLQISGAELFLAALGLPNQVTGSTQLVGAPVGATSAALVPAGTVITGYRRVAASQVQVTATKSMPSIARADQLVLVGEIGATVLHALPSDVNFNGPATYLPSTLFGALLTSGGSMQTDGFVTRTSWGYRLAGRLEYPNLLLSGNVSPRVAFSHDVRGVGPSFNQGVKSWSAGVSWDYQRKWVVDAQYTGFFGGRTYCGTDNPAAVPAGQPASFCSSANPLKDRDFYSLSVSYSF
jgi:hypothetical protein